MRKISQRHLRVLVWRSKIRFSKEVNRRQGKRRRLLETGTVRVPQIASAATKVLIEPPADFSFETNFDGVVAYLAQLRHEIGGKDKKQVIADLRTIRSLCPSAAICLVAELERWQRLRKQKLYPITVAKWDENVRTNLYSMGFFRLLETKLPQALRRHNRANAPIWLPFSSQILVNGAVPRQLRRRIEVALGSLGELRSALYVPLIEAIKNAVEHAYDGDEVSEEVKQSVGRRWWLLGVADPSARKLTIVVFDQGITIPVSLPKSRFWSVLSPAVLTKGGSDNARIEAAVEYGSTRTKLDERGKGLADIVGLASKHGSNHVRIFSRLGRYHAIGATAQYVAPSAIPLNGTLIRWDIIIPNEHGEVL